MSATLDDDTRGRIDAALQAHRLVLAGKRLPDDYMVGSTFHSSGGEVRLVIAMIDNSEHKYPGGEALYATVPLRGPGHLVTEGTEALQTWAAAQPRGSFVPVPTRLALESERGLTVLEEVRRNLLNQMQHESGSCSAATSPFGALKSSVL